MLPIFLFASVENLLRLASLRQRLLSKLTIFGIFFSLLSSSGERNEAAETDIIKRIQIFRIKIETKLNNSKLEKKKKNRKFSFVITVVNLASSLSERVS